MCGICGVYGQADTGIIRDMAGQLAHRGPDEEGFHSAGAIRLGVRRLSIVDEEAGTQPIFNEEGNICVILNGEIYNHQELRAALEEKGHRFQTGSDTEVLVHLYEEVGKSCVNHIEGMYAFAIQDGDTLFLARDKFGIKPLYYAVKDDAFIFASECKAILEHPVMTPRMNWEALRQIGVFGHLIDNSTMFEGLKQLRPGHFIEVNEDGSTRGQYATIEVNSHNAAKEGSPSVVRSLFEEGVEKRFMGDFPVGVFLSGGVDSSILAWTANELADSAVKTFSIADDPDNEDVASARHVADAIGTDHHQFILEPDEVLSAIPTFLHHIEVPDYKFVYWYLVSQKASDHIKVGLSGEGADEQFFGYPWYEQPQAKVEQWRTRLENTGAVDRKPQVFQQYQEDDVQPDVQEGMKEYGMKSQLQNFQLLPVDHGTMAASMEVRVPYLDTELVNYSLSVPATAKLQKRRKMILRKAFSDTSIPSRVIRRPKQFGGTATFAHAFDKFDELSRYYIEEEEINSEIWRLFRGRKDYLLSFKIFQELYFADEQPILSSFPSAIGRTV